MPLIGNWKVYLAIALGCVNMGIGLKMLSFLNVWVYFPAFPNIIDWLFVTIGSIVLLILVLNRELRSDAKA